MGSEGQAVASHRGLHCFGACKARLGAEDEGQEPPGLLKTLTDLVDSVWWVETYRIADRHPADRDACFGWDSTADVGGRSQREATGCPEDRTVEDHASGCHEHMVMEDGTADIRVRAHQDLSAQSGRMASRASQHSVLHDDAARADLDRPAFT